MLAIITHADEPPTIPVGYDAYRQWDKWYLQRIGARAYMRSTYDRAGGNEGADASHFLYQLADDKNVTLDVEGRGVLYFARYNHWHGSPWHYIVDGSDNIVQETSTKDPLHPAERSAFEPREAFPSPLAFTWSTTKGADLSWVPIGFEKSFQMAYSRTRYGTGYYIYHQFVPGAKLSQNIESWKPDVVPPKDVVELLRHPSEDRIDSELHEVDATRAIAGPGVIRGIVVNLPISKCKNYANARLKITWDDRHAPSVDAPLALFFGAGVLRDAIDGHHLVKAMPMSIWHGTDNVLLSCAFPMPFFKSARIELQGAEGALLRVHVEPLRDPPNHVGYFHATYRDFPKPGRGKDLVLLDTRGIEGSQDWTGSFVGTSWIFSHNAVLGTLEGDPRFFFDDSESPQGQATGTEEWGGGGDYWGGENMTLPFAGHPCGAKSAKDAKSEEDKIESAYRFLLADLFPFGKNARIQLEHGGTNQSAEHYETVTYWYGLPGSSLVQTDKFNVADQSDAKAHQYDSPDASKSYEIESRYELGVDHIKTDEIYPTQKMTARSTTGTSTFVMKIDPDNWGVMLRRTLDYQFPNQRAEVSVANADEKEPQWKPAGIWYTAGSNRCVYSNPKEELGATQHNIQISNRRFRDDEFLIGRDLTRGKKAIRVRVKFTPVNRPITPGAPLDPQAWSEIRYSAYSFVMPNAP
jgi:hypothetical protein